MNVSRDAPTIRRSARRNVLYTATRPRRAVALASVVSVNVGAKPTLSRRIARSATTPPPEAMARMSPGRGGMSPCKRDGTRVYGRRRAERKDHIRFEAVRCGTGANAYPHRNSTAAPPCSMQPSVGESCSGFYVAGCIPYARPLFCKSTSSFAGFTGLANAATSILCCGPSSRPRSRKRRFDRPN
jgi:hypothetical protein